MDGIVEFLKDRRERSMLRTLRPASLRKGGKIYFKGREYFDLCSNDYLGLADHPKLKQAAKRAIEEFGTSSSASRLLSGDLKIHHELEEKVAAFKGKEKALVFNSGYQANVGILNSLCGKDDVILSDRLDHASILDGAILSQAKLIRFNHNDLNHIEYLLEKERCKFKNCLLVVETIYSMDGDRPPLREIVGLKEKYNCKIMVDEAHATGIFGKSGSGVVEEEDLIDEVDLILGTFGKALGSFGAYIASSKEFVEYLINACRSFIYTTALPPSVIAANLASLEVIRDEPFRREELLKNSNFFRNEIEKMGFKVNGSSQIVPLIINDTEETIKLSEYLQEKKYWVLPIRPPTVPKGEDRLRFSLSYHHDKKILRKLVKSIVKYRT